MSEFIVVEATTLGPVLTDQETRTELHKEWSTEFEQVNTKLAEGRRLAHIGYTLFTEGQGMHLTFLFDDETDAP